MANDVSLAEVRATYADLTRELFRNRVAYLKRKAEIIDQYGSVQFDRNDVILSDLSSAARTLSAIISALTAVLGAELAWAEWHNRAPGETDRWGNLT